MSAEIRERPRRFVLTLVGKEQTQEQAAARRYIQRTQQSQGLEVVQELLDYLGL